MFESETLSITDDEKKRAIVLAHHVMGNGNTDKITDVVYVSTDSFNPAKTGEMVLELDRINSEFVTFQKEYILIVAGRLGSSDPWLGIPVVWSQISQAAVIVETSLPGFQVEPSQGTHFFQNITSLGTIYFTVNPVHNDGLLDLPNLTRILLLKRVATLPI